MAVKITQSNEKWKIEIANELWEFPSREVMEKKLKEILDTKETYGRIREC